MRERRATCMAPTRWLAWCRRHRASRGRVRESRPRGRIALARHARRSSPAGHTACGAARRPERPSRPMATSSCPTTSAGRSNAGHSAPRQPAVQGGLRDASFYARVTGDVYAEHRVTATPIQTNAPTSGNCISTSERNRASGRWNVTGQTGDQESADQAFSSTPRIGAARR